MPNPAPTQLPAVASAAEKVVYAEQDASNSLVIRSTATERVLACVYTDEDEITQEEWDNARLICDSINTYDRNQATIAQLQKDLAVANGNHEHFEREWYLAKDRVDAQAATIAALRKALGAAHHLLMQLPSNSAADEADIRKVLREAESVLKASDPAGNSEAK
jgi:hypothetical protein